MKRLKPLKFWLILQLNVSWLVAISLILWYNLPEAQVDYLIIGFLGLQLIMAYAAGFTTGYATCHDRTTST